MSKPSKPLSTHSKSFKFLAIISILFLLVAFWWLFILKSFQPPTPTQPVLQKESVDENKALKTIAEQEEVKNYLKEVPNGKIALDHFDKETNSYVFQIFEVKNGHTNTFNWYEVNKENGELKPLLP